MSYKVRIDSFEGPFDLLLYLVSRQKVDIGAISITEIADQYLEEVSRMDNLDLDVASDFLLVASTLLEIKAQSLIPRDRDELDDEVAELAPSEARDILVSRLMEYKKFKNAAAVLHNRFIAEGRMHTRPFGPDAAFLGLMPDFLRGVTADALAYQAAAALAPFAGPYAEALFAVGLIAASFLAACVLPLTTAFVICEAFGWEAGVSFKWREAPTFKSIFTFVIAFSAVVVLLPDVNLLTMMLTAQFVNGVILPILLAFMAIISADKRIMGEYRSRRLSKVLLWATVGVVAALTVVLLVMQVLGLA